jgi:hypothetical protein
MLVFEITFKIIFFLKNMKLCRTPVINNNNKYRNQSNFNYTSQYIAKRKGIYMQEI